MVTINREHIKCYTCGRWVTVKYYRDKPIDVAIMLDGEVVCNECASKLGFMRRNI